MSHTELENYSQRKELLKLIIQKYREFQEEENARFMQPFGKGLTIEE